MIDLSIIIPVYNGEHYIKQCLDSIIPQLKSTVEVIVINDGSQDNSLSLLKSYENIVLLNNVNKGPGLSRNAGIRVAKGRYVSFVDIDDYLANDYIELILNKIQSNPDVIFLDLMQIAENGKKLSKESISQYSKLSKEDLIKYHMTSKIPWGGVRKVVLKDLLIKNEILFGDGIVGEEAAYTLKLLLLSNRFEFINKTVYYYINHPNSQSKKGGLYPYLPLIKEYENILLKYDENQKYRKTLNSFRYVSLCVTLKRIAINYNLKDSIELYKNIVDNLDFKLNSLEFKSLKFKYKLVYLPLKLRLYKFIYQMLRK